MTENKRYEFDVMNGGGYVVGYSERMDDDISLMFTRLCEVPTKTQAEDVCNELKGLQKENRQLKSDNNRLVNETAKIVAEHQGRVLDLIDKSLEKDKYYYEMSYESYLNGRIEALEDLKKELTKQ